MEIKENSLNSSSLKCFWQAMYILITKPHVVNKRLWGCTILNKLRCMTLPSNWVDNLNNIKLENLQNSNNLVKTLQLQSTENDDFEIEIIIVELYPKNYEESHAYQLISLNKNEGSVTFADVTPRELAQNLCPTFMYVFCINDGNIILKASDINSKSYIWLKETVLPQVIKWSNEQTIDQPKAICNDSLILVSNDKYYKKYNDLKLKYGRELVKIWPECTDPSKFVYEDIAIATYLLLLWDENSTQTFVDIGCGNGLLVYILTMEGHLGLGVDVRKRKIWDMYPDNIKLKESTVTLNNIHQFSNTDWIIGNHSDELTPWIPVFAATSSFKCNYFLLPCCAYNFNGTKYQRQDSSKSQYTEYLEYIKRICDYCGFNTQVDRLKIPSTKRICLVGKSRTYKENDHSEHCTLINDLIKEEIGASLDVSESVKTRDPVERVRNCTQIDKNVTDYIVMCITKYLLEECSNEFHESKSWSIGKKVDIKNLIQLIPNDKLQVLKSECGGLQTLLRNNHHIFQVQGGCVQLRYPRTTDELHNNLRNKKNNPIRIKVKKCWFYNNHPQGCPLDGNVCSYLHEKLL